MGRSPCDGVVGKGGVGIRFEYGSTWSGRGVFDGQGLGLLEIVDGPRYGVDMSFVRFPTDSFGRCFGICLGRCFSIRLGR